jgi:4-alpha-glucanotransferase
MKHSSSLTDIVRIDHFRGFESFWSVPYGSATARAGKWVPGPGDSLFEALEEALGSLPIVAEDLGVITPEVDKLRLDHGMPGMVVLQFKAGDPEFDIDAIDKNSVCYTGTHDNDTTVGWFLGTGEDTRTPEDVLATRKQALQLTGGTAETIHMNMIRLAFSSPATLAMAPMQDYLGLGSEARLNVPGTTLNNWRWRMREDQLDERLVESVKKMVVEASRTRRKRLDSSA